MSRRIIVVIVSTLLTAACANAQQRTPVREATSYANRAEVRSFIEEMVERHAFDRRQLEILFARAHFQAPIVKAMDPQPAGKRSWEAYRARFVNPRNVEEGVQFWRDNRGSLARAEVTYGVPQEIIVAIIGIETRYGRNAGSWRVIDALSTLAFDYPRRAAFFRSELEQFLIYARESSLDAASIRGSFAGAVGIPQFMPGSYRRFAVDFDGDGRRDLFGSTMDAIGSVANFLREHGWVPGEPTALPATIEGQDHRRLLQAGIRPTVPAGTLGEHGVRTLEILPPERPVALVELESPERPSVYYVGLANFYAITRYNQSSFYAISVIELAHALRRSGESTAAALPL